jgi:hypothetical protein
MATFERNTLAASLLLLTVATAHAANIGLYNTGVDASNNLLALGATDNHYTVTSSLPSGPSLTYAVNDAKDYIGYWMAPNTSSTWITPFVTADNYASSGSLLAEYYDYTTTFNLAGVDLSTVELLGKAASDNYILGVSLNGHEQSLSGGYSAWTTFDWNQYFDQGVNTLVFHTQNLNGQSGSGGPTGLRVEMEFAPGLSDAPAVPVPSAVWLLGSGLLGLASLRAQRKNV